MLSNLLSKHLILCCPLPLLLSVFLSIRVFSIELALRIRWPKYWSFSFSISPSNEHSGLISFMTDCFWSPCSPRESQESSLTPQLKSINSLALSLLYAPTLTSIMTTEKIIASTRWTFVSKVMFLLFNTLFRFAIAFLPTSKCINCMATVTVYSDFGAQKVKSVSPSPCHEMMRLDVMIFVLWMLSFKPAFLLSFFTFIKRLFTFCH